jgi:ketosteroid isomerase-like protein
MSDMEQSDEVTVELLQDIIAAFNRRDVPAVVSYFAEDATFFMSSGAEVTGRRVHGKAAIAKVLADRFVTIPDMHWASIDDFVSGSKAVSTWRVTGTLSDGSRLNANGCDIWEFRGNLVLNKDTYWKIVTPKN